MQSTTPAIKKHIIFNLPMVKGGGGGWMQPPTGFTSFSREWEARAFIPNF